MGEIVAVTSPDGSPPYRCAGSSGEYESEIFPGPRARGLYAPAEVTFGGRG